MLDKKFRVIINYKLKKKDNENMQFELEEAKKPDKKVCSSDQNIPELRPAEIEDQGCKTEQINTMKASDGQIIDQDILNAYCLEQVGLDSVAES